MEDAIFEEKKKAIFNTVFIIRPSYAIPLFINYLWKAIEDSYDPRQEYLQLFNKLESIIEQKWHDFQITSADYQKNVISALLQKNYPEYNKNNTLREFLYESIDMSKRPFDHFLRIEEELKKSNGNPPYGWQACLTKHLSRDLIESLEALRTDPLFKNYVDLKTKWLQGIKNLVPGGTDAKKIAFQNHKKYAEILPRVQDWIMKQLYFNFENVNQRSFVKFMESDFASFKAKKFSQ